MSSEEKEKQQQEDEDSCDHQIVYYGATNINENRRTIGSVDVWRCIKCKKRFCEEKQLGIEDIAGYVGMPIIDKNERWAVLVCTLRRDKERWKLVKLGRKGELSHQCVDDKEVKLDVQEYKVDDSKHWSFLVDDHIHKSVEI